jgi:hypothetical protein
MKRLRVGSVGVGFLAIASSVLLSEGQISQPWPSQVPITSQKTDDSQRTDQQEKMRIVARQKRIVADSDKLLLLATDLKARIDKSGATTLSVDEIKKTEEIEKLAHSLKERLKG